MISHYFFPIVGGIERQLYSLGRSLQARGLAVEVVTCGMDGLSAEESFDGLRVRRLPGILRRQKLEELGFWGRIYGQAKMNVRMAMFINRHRREYDIIHRHSAAFAYDIVVARWLGKRTIAKVTTGADVSADASRLGRKLRLWRFLLQRLNAWALRRVDAVISISSEIHQILLDNGVRKDHIADIPNGVDTARFAPPDRPEKARLRSDLGLPETAPVALFVGRLERRKGLDLLLEVWPEILREFPAAILLVLGDGPERRASEDLALKLGLNENVWFLGMKDDMVTFYRAADVYVSPSRFEGLSNALLEAMSAGLPVVATRVSGAEDVVNEGENGLLVNPDDPKGLAAALKRMLGTPSWREKLSTTARRTIVEKYSMSAVADQYVSLYRRLLQ